MSFIDTRQNIYRCPCCNYTHADAAYNMDHHICERKGGPKMPKLSKIERAEMIRELNREASK